MALPPKTQISEPTVNRMLDAQSRDQELKARELVIRQEELKAQADFAHKMLAAQVGDRQGERTHVSKLLTIKLAATGAAMVLLLCFLGYGLYLGKDAVVMDMVKVILSTIVGAFGGYGYRAHKDQQKEESEQ